jgi:hypothetical protein
MKSRKARKARKRKAAKRSDLLLSAKCLLFLKAAVQNAGKSRK